MRAIFLTVLLGCSGSGGSTAASSGSGANSNETPPDAEMRAMVEAHNAARAAAAPTPGTPLVPLKWSESDAVVARAYAEQCVFSHNPNRGERGENLYASTAETGPETVVAAWVDEQRMYDYASNKCSGMCGHYTQVVWADTTHVGCAKKMCPAEGSPFSGRPWQNWVCNYSPPGNYVGQKPY
jgi:pathogenesis-related protein 1